jgi:hypothetical protein
MNRKSAPLERGRRPAATGSKTGPQSCFLVENEGDLHDIQPTAVAFPTRPDKLAGVEIVGGSKI